jgi:hypothetical protein
MEYLVVRNKIPLFGSRLHFLKEWDEEKGFKLAYLSKKWAERKEALGATYCGFRKAPKIPQYLP